MTEPVPQPEPVKYKNLRKPKRARMKEAAEAREQFTALILNGMSQAAATRLIGKSPNWFDITKKHHPAWGENITRIRLSRLDNDLPAARMADFAQGCFNHKPALHHYRMMEAIELAKPDSITLILGFPGMGKTTVMVDTFCYWLGTNPDKRICVISEGQDLSRKIISQVSARMLEPALYPAYHQLYGPFKAPRWDDNQRNAERGVKKPWNADYFQVAKSSNDEKEPSLEARGATGRLYGGRYDEMVLDDIQSNETIGASQALLNSLRVTWLSRPIPGQGKTTIIGSRVGPGDFYELLDTHEMVDTTITIPALTVNVPRDEHFIRKNGRIVVNPDCPAQPTWDALTLKDLAVRRWKVGEEVWNRTYMQSQISSEGATFTEDMIEKAKDYTRVLGPAHVGTDTLGSVDPALDSGICAYMIAATSPSRLFVLDSLAKTDTHTYADTFEQINLLSERYRPSKWIIETNNYQKGLLQDDRLDTLTRRHHFTVQPHWTGRNKDDNIMGIRMMASAFLDGEISIPWGDPETREAMAPLVSELRNWKPGARGSQLRMDRVMTLWFLWRSWTQDRDEGMMNPPQLWRPSWVG